MLSQNSRVFAPAELDAKGAGIIWNTTGLSCIDDND